ncbi:MAG: YIP1 family protein [Candidatus Bathyarchaeia archaeon]
MGEHEQLSMYGTLKNIFKVIYAPREAFKEIIQNPKYIGPILIMILFTVANMGYFYTIVSKTYVEQTLPTAEQLDRWTENSTLWTGALDVAVKDNFVDYINGTYYGNRSIEFSIVNGTQIWMKLNDTGSINCSGPDGYKNLYLRIKWTSPEVNPENVTIYLFSAASSDYFRYNLTEEFSNSTSNVWNNLTIPLATESWLNNSADANWGNIRGLKLEFAWLNNSNITLLVDGLFFGGIFKSQAENATSYMLNFSIVSFMQFTIRWVFLGGLLYIMTKAFRAKTVWRPLLILVGFALITMFVQAVINVAAFSTLPRLDYPLEFLGGVKGETENAYNKIMEKTLLVSQISGYIQIAIIFWTIALCAIATRLLTEFSWSKSFLVATVAYFVTTLAQSFLLGF